MLIERAIRALRDPRPFFQWMAEGPRRPWAAYALVVLQTALGLSLSVVLISKSTEPQLQQASEILRSSGVATAGFVAVAVLVSPILAVLGWALSWLIVRIGAGPGDRLWEVAAWCQLPSLAMVPISTWIAFAMPEYTAGVMVLVAIWCAWFVHAGVEELAHGQSMRAAVVYAALFVGYAALTTQCSGAPAPTPGPYMG